MRFWIQMKKSRKSKFWISSFRLPIWFYNDFRDAFFHDFFLKKCFWNIFQNGLTPRLLGRFQTKWTGNRWEHSLSKHSERGDLFRKSVLCFSRPPLKGNVLTFSALNRACPLYDPIFRPLYFFGTLNEYQKKVLVPRVCFSLEIVPNGIAI